MKAIIKKAKKPLQKIFQHTNQPSQEKTSEMIPKINFEKNTLIRPQNMPSEKLKGYDFYKSIGSPK